MKTGPRYKKARRLGPEVFEKTQTQKFAMRQSRKTQSRGPRAGSEFGRQLLEKQKARFTYGINEKQFGNYVAKAMVEKGDIKTKLYQMLEMRADNTVFKIGLANSRQASRQMVSHGHILVNGKRITIPSYALSIGDILRIKEGSMKSPLFKDLNEKMKGKNLPNWISFDANKVEWKIIGTPTFTVTNVAFDISAILEFYTR